MESIETLTKLERRPWRVVAVVGVLMLLVAWRILSVMAANVPIGGYGDFSDTDYGDVDWDRVAVLVVECVNDQGFPVTASFDGPGVSFGAVPLEQNAAATKTTDRCQAGLNFPEFASDSG